MRGLCDRRGSDGVVSDSRPQFGLRAANSNKLSVKEFAEAGGLFTYGPNLPDLYRRAAVYFDKILKGCKTCRSPRGASTKLELVVNLKAAKQIGLSIPPNVLARADKLIK